MISGFLLYKRISISTNCRKLYTKFYRVRFSEYEFNHKNHGKQDDN